MLLSAILNYNKQALFNLSNANARMLLSMFNMIANLTEEGIELRKSINDKYQQSICIIDCEDLNNSNEKTCSN